MVKENWVVNTGWKNRQAAKNAVRKNESKKMMLIPHPSMHKTWIEVPVPEVEVLEGDKFFILRQRQDSARWLTVQDILTQVSEYTRLSIEEICQKTRKRTIVEPRQVAMYLSREHTHESLADIGYQIGRKDHVTVSHSCKTVQNLLDTSAAFREKWKGVL